MIAFQRAGPWDVECCLERDRKSTPSKLVLSFARENPRWGYPRIAVELLKLGLHVSLSTIRRILLTAYSGSALRRSGPSLYCCSHAGVEGSRPALAPPAEAGAKGARALGTLVWSCPSGGGVRGREPRSRRHERSTR